VFGADVYDDERAKVAARLAAGELRDSRRQRVLDLLSYSRGI
jgi:hypothetical protein